jgi:hypothetical protein
MGQRIEIDSMTVIENTVVVSTNRSFTGTDGEGFESSEVAAESGSIAGKLAAELFEADGALTRVYIDQNSLIASSTAGWDEAKLAAVSSVIEDFFLFYPDA